MGLDHFCQLTQDPDQGRVLSLVDYATQDCRADLAMHSPSIGPQGFPTVGSYVNVDL